MYLHQLLSMACLVTHVVLFFSCSSECWYLGMLCNTSQYSICLHSGLTSTLVHALIMWSFLFPCHYYAAATVSASVHLLPFITMPFMIANSFPIGHYSLMLWSTSAFLCGQCCITYAFSSWSFVSSCVAVCITSMDLQTGMFTEVLIAFTF